LKRTDEPRARPERKRGAWLGLVLLLGIVACVAGEIRTSFAQSWLLSRYAARLSFEVGDGPSPRIAHAGEGPFDARVGYSRIPEFGRRLVGDGFRLARQAKVSEELARLVSWGIEPPYESGATALLVRGEGGTPLFDAAPADREFASFEEIPRLLVDTLLYIENRELPEPKHPQSNPAIEWDRLAKAGLLYTGGKVGLPFAVHGGSTLATQMEKFRHSPEGRTESPIEKLRQVAAASLKAYRDGPDTRPWRRQIVLDYVNSMPLAGAVGYGEVHGIGSGLWAWFGLRLSDVRAALASARTTEDKVAAYKAVLALIVSLPAPSTWLAGDRDALAERADRYTRALAAAGVLEWEFARAVLRAPLRFLPRAPAPPAVSFAKRKASSAIRIEVARLLGVASLYDLDRLHLEVASTIDVALQDEVTSLFESLGDRTFVAAHALDRERLLDRGDPSKVAYSLLLYERTTEGSALRVHADNLDRPFDLNRGMKLELGSTAKLRTLAHYLEIVAEIHGEVARFDSRTLRGRRAVARDPLTTFVLDAHLASPGIGLEALLERALDRRYSASPGEAFFTGGGLHHFHNFDSKENGRVPTVREALRTSTNLVFVRILRDLVRHHASRLPFDAKRVLADPEDPLRREMLVDIADEENRSALAETCRAHRGASESESITLLLGGSPRNLRDLSLVFYAWNPGADESRLYGWIRPRLAGGISEAEARALHARHGNLPYGIADAAYLLGRNPLELWCAGALRRNPELDDAALYARSGHVRRLASRWLLTTRNRSAQNLRLRVRIEREAFARMTPYWTRLGFPFPTLVPSYATAIGSSTDRPAALADLVGIILADGVRQPPLHVRTLRFAAGTPYETVYAARAALGERVMEPLVARALRRTLASVVAGGTARRLDGAFTGAAGEPLVAGGKTGSGDNRHKTFARGGAVVSSRVINRTATFVFFVGDRYYGVLTAVVLGEDAGAFGFTSALPVSVLKLLAPSLNERLRGAAPLPGAPAETLVRLGVGPARGSAGS
jgi:membrane peptidoglycan carboxypeptidase